MNSRRVICELVLYEQLDRYFEFNPVHATLKSQRLVISDFIQSIKLCFKYSDRPMLSLSYPIPQHTAPFAVNISDTKKSA
jgi:hypothetical protein